MRHNPHIPPFDPAAVMRLDGGRDLWEVHAEAEEASRRPLTAREQARVDVYEAASVKERRAGSAAWRGLIAPAFGHPTVAETLISAPGIDGTTHRQVAMRALSAHIDYDANAATNFAYHAHDGRSKERAFGACLAHADRHAPAAGSIAYAVTSHDRADVATEEGWRWIHHSPRNMARLVSSRFRIDMPTGLALAVFRAHSDAGDPQAAALFTRLVLGRKAHNQVAEARRVLLDHVGSDNPHCAMMLANLAKFAGDPELREVAWDHLVELAPTSPFAASRLATMAARDPERRAIARRALTHHLDDVVCATNLMRMVAHNPNDPDFARFFAAGVEAAEIDRRASVQLARMAATDEQRHTAHTILAGWDQPDDWQIAALAETAGCDTDRAAIAPHVDAALERRSALVADAAWRHLPDHVDEDVLFAAVLDRAAGGHRDSANIVARMAADHPERAATLADAFAEAVADGRLPAANIVHVANIVPSVAPRALPALLARAATDGEAAVVAAGYHSYCDQATRDRMWDVCLTHASSRNAEVRVRAATRLPALAGTDPDRRQAAWDVLEPLSDHHAYCASALLRLIDTDGQRDIVWDRCVKHARTSAHAASALVSLVRDGDDREVAWHLVAPHARTDAYCASALVGLAGNNHERRAIAFDRCLAHPMSTSTANAAAALATSREDHDRLWDAVGWRAPRIPEVATTLARSADTPQRRDLARQACLRHAAKHPQAAAALRYLIDTDEDRDDAHDAVAAHAPSNAHCAGLAFTLATNDRDRDRAANLVRRHARNGDTHALVMMPKVAETDTEFREALDTLTDHVHDHAYVATALAAHAEPGSVHAQAAWDGCLTAIGRGQLRTASSLANLAADNPMWADEAWNVGLECAATEPEVAASMVRHASGPQLDELLPLLRRHATRSPVAATGLYAAWREGADVPATEVWDALRQYAPVNPAAASAASAMAETDDEMRFAWDCNLRQRYVDEVCAHALGTLVRSSADAVQATDALRYWRRDDAADALLERLDRTLTGRQATA